MSALARELELLGRALRTTSGGRYDEIYAAQQALSWAQDPQAFKSPSVMLTDIQEGLEDCLDFPRPLQSSGIHSQNG